MEEAARDSEEEEESKPIFPEMSLPIVFKFFTLVLDYINFDIYVDFGLH